VCGHSGLLEKPVELSDFQFSVQGHYATGAVTPKDNMAATLSNDGKSKLLECPDRLRSGDDRQVRHGGRLRTW